MVNYMVAVDESKNAEAAFHTALQLVRSDPANRLFIATVYPDTNRFMNFTFMGDPEAEIPLTQVIEQTKKKAYALVRKYGEIARKEGIEAVLIAGPSNHVGELLCQAADKRKIDVLVLGRRGMSKLSRLLVGSTSKYCLEHAQCDVLIVKGEWGPAEEHQQISEITTLEEEERERRIKEDQPQDELHKKVGQEAAEVAAFSQVAQNVMPVLEMTLLDA